MKKFKFEFSLYDKFYLKPKLWKQRSPHTGRAAEYFGHTWSWTVHWLWFELLVYGIP